VVGRLASTWATSRRTGALGVALVESHEADGLSSALDGPVEALAGGGRCRAYSWNPSTRTMLVLAASCRIAATG